VPFRVSSCFDDIDLCVSSSLGAGIVGMSRLGRSIVWCLGVLAFATVWELN